MRTRVLVVGTVATFSLASVALLAYLLFVSRRNLVRTGDANLQRWVDPTTAAWLYLGFVAVLAAGFIAFALVGTAHAGRSDVAARPWRRGGGLGGATGAAIGILTIITGPTATAVALLTAPVLLAYLGALLGPPVVGGLAAHATGRAASGALAGLWFGLTMGLVAGFALVTRDVVFADRLVAGAWLTDHFGDATCNNQTGDTLAACEIGDSLGTMASDWLLFPLLGAGLGALGGLVGRAGAGTTVDRPSLRAPVGLGVLLIVVFAAELAFHLW
ncbi:MAG TPA: hypothetical protein VH561_15675 [Micromonosporaceae bacterium]